MSSTITTENIVKRFVKAASVYVPQVPKPKKKISLTEKFVWTGIALFAYLVMAQIPLYGVTDDPRFDFLAFARVIFAAQQGTLMELGIGPIVTAGLLMQLLKGSGLIKLDFKNTDDRSLFTSATKIVTIIVIVAEGGLYGGSIYGPLTAEDAPLAIYVVIAQLIGASVIVMLMDEMLQKGWGVGSGLSLFIMAGIAQTILWSVFPIVSTKYRGFTAVYPIKLLYTSVIPVILASALLANAVFMGQMLWANYNPNNTNPAFNWIATFDPAAQGGGGQASPTGGILYYITAPRGLDVAAADPIRS